MFKSRFKFEIREKLKEVKHTERSAGVDCFNHFNTKTVNKKTSNTISYMPPLYHSLNSQKGKFASMVGKLQLKLKRRPTIETLSRNGYYKDEPCFGNDLSNTIMHDVHFDVPKILVEAVKVLESSSLYMKSLGLYRISGSHTVIQKLRYKVKLKFTRGTAVVIKSIIVLDQFK